MRKRLSEKAIKGTACITVIFFVLGSAVPLGSITVEERAGYRKKREYRSKNKESTIDNTVRSRRDPLADKDIVETPESRVREKRDPRLACILSVILPGSGHIYLRRDMKGIGFCLATGAGYTATGYYLYRSFLGAGKGDSMKSKVVVSGLFFFVSSILHVVNVVEAYADAVEMNKKEIYEDIPKNPYRGGIEYR